MNKLRSCSEVKVTGCTGQGHGMNKLRSWGEQVKVTGCTGEGHGMNKSRSRDVRVKVVRLESVRSEFTTREWIRTLDLFGNVAS